MMRRAVLLGAMLAAAGCAGRQTPPVPKPSQEAEFFAPSAMKLSPVFTKVSDFDGDHDPDGVEAVVELQDRFGDPTKAAGRILFQIYRFAPANPDPRGDRIAGPYEGRIDSAADQKARWSRVNRAYIFQLGFPLAALDKDYVLEATFEAADGQRLFDRLVIEGDHTKPGPTTGPAPLTTPNGASTQPATGAVTTQSVRTLPVTSQPHEPPPRADQP
ncbi:MAG: hypothetical protein QM754_03675 [Tepidisphaeraceae bacterium]